MLFLYFVKKLINKLLENEHSQEATSVEKEKEKKKTSIIPKKRAKTQGYLT